MFVTHIASTTVICALVSRSFCLFWAQLLLWKKVKLIQLHYTLRLLFHVILHHHHYSRVSQLLWYFNILKKHKKLTILNLYKYKKKQNIEIYCCHLRLVNFLQMNTTISLNAISQWYDPFLSMYCPSLYYAIYIVL